MYNKILLTQFTSKKYMGTQLIVTPNNQIIYNALQIMKLSLKHLDQIQINKPNS